MNFDQLMKNAWPKELQSSVEDLLRTQLLEAETRILQLEREVKMLRGQFPVSGPAPQFVAPKVSAKLCAPLCQPVKGPVTPTTRTYIYEAFHGRCFYCKDFLEEHKATMDHQIPKSKGGRNHRSNLVLSCSGCNNAKGDRMPTSDELERASVTRKAYDERPANAVPFRDTWKEDTEREIEESMKPKWPSVRNQIAMYAPTRGIVI